MTTSMSEKLNKIEMGKQYRCRDGRAAKLLCVDRNHPEFPVLALIIDEDGTDYWEEFTEYGKYNYKFAPDSLPDKLDLVEVRPRIKRTVWMNVYPEADRYHIFDNHVDADMRAKSDRLACVQVDIDVEEGHGLT